MDIRKIFSVYYAYIMSALKKKNVIAGLLIGTMFSFRISVMYLRYTEGYTIQSMEPFVMGLSDIGDAMLLIFGCLLALADAPFVDGNAFLLLHRVGKKNWYVAVWLYMITLCVAYYLFCMGVSCLPAMFDGYAENRWSQSFLSITKGNAGLLSAYGLSAPDFVITQMTPYMVALCASLSIVLYTVFLCGVMFILNVNMNKKAVGSVAVFVVHMGALYMAGNLTFGYDMTKWSLLRQGIFVAYSDRGLPDFSFSYVFLILIIYILFLFGERSMQWVDIIACEKEEKE